jgi:hypothetical protein
MRSIYIIGSMRNPRVPEVAKALREIGWDAFDDWYSSGPESDDKWQEYERARGRTYKEAAAGLHARNAFNFDKWHLDRCDAAVLVMPAGKSAHNEIGYMEGRGKPAYILLAGEPDRYDIMPPNFATAVFESVEEMLEHLK